MAEPGIICETMANTAIIEAARLSQNTLALAQRYTPDQLSGLLCLGQSWVWETDAEHRFTFISSAMEAATGLEAQHSLGRTRRECFFGADALTPAMLAHIDDLENHRSFKDFVFRSSGKTQNKLWVSISGTPQFGAKGQFTGYIGISRGLSEQVFIESGLKNAADQLSRVEKLMQEVFESVPVGISLYDKENRLIACNHLYRNMYSVIADILVPGAKIEDILEATFDRKMVTVSPFELGETQAETRQKWIAERLGQYEVGVYANITRLANGRSLKQFSKRLDDGTFISVRVDVTDQVERDTILADASYKTQKSRERLRNTVEGLSTGFALWDTANTLLMCNERFHDLISVGVPFAEGETYESIIVRIIEHGQVAKACHDADQWLAEDLRSMREDAEIEDIYTLPDGRWILRRVTLSPNGEKVDIRTDITEIKTKEKSLTAALEDALLAQTVINNLSEPVFVKDADLNFVFCNDAFAKILNSNAKDFPGKRAAFCVSAAEAALFEASELALLESGATYELEEDHFEDGVQKTRILRKSRMTTTSGKHYVAGYMFDITALRQREHAMAAASRRAESADKAKSDFLAHMSHEIRTPMNGVLSMTELLQHSTLDERQRVFVEIIRKSGETLLATINSILEYTKIESGALNLESTSFPLRAAIEDVAEMMVAKAIEKETDIIISIQPDLPAILIGDEGRFRQIVTNLLSNAVKFTENGQIKVSVRGREIKTGQIDLELMVSDTGRGIPADKIDMIFDRFAQISSSDFAKVEGTGLGLSIVSKLAKMMGGLCRVQSTLGKGSTFYVDLPMGCTDVRAPSTPMSDALRAKRVLIIDANAEWCRSLMEPLKFWGFDVAAVESPHTAVALAKALKREGHMIDLVLIGCNKPTMSCIEIGYLIDSEWPCPPATKLFLAPINATITEQVKAALNVHSLLTLPVKLAALYHHVIGALQAKTDVIETSKPFLIDQNTKAERPRLSRVDLLIAEDNPINQLVFTQILSGSGLAYQIVANGELAVEAFQDMQPSLILMDIGMPKLNGFEATKAIRAMAALGGDSVPIIAVTASATGEDRESCLKAGMNDHLAKPISPEALLGKIAQWMPNVARKIA